MLVSEIVPCLTELVSYGMIYAKLPSDGEAVCLKRSKKQAANIFSCPSAQLMASIHREEAKYFTKSSRLIAHLFCQF